MIQCNSNNSCYDAIFLLCSGKIVFKKCPSFPSKLSWLSIDTFEDRYTLTTNKHFMATSHRPPCKGSLRIKL